MISANKLHITPCLCLVLTVYTSISRDILMLWEKVGYTETEIQSYFCDIFLILFYGKYFYTYDMGKLNWIHFCCKLNS